VLSTTALAATFAGLYVFGAVATGFTGAIAWHRRRGTPAAIALVVFMVSLTGCCLTELVVLLSNTGFLPPALLFAAFAPIIPISAMMPAGLWAMSQAVANQDWRPSRRVLATLSIHPVLAILVVALNGNDGPLYRVARHTGAAWPSFTPRSLFVPYLAILYLVMIWTCVTLVRAWWHGSPLQRRQAGAMLVAILVPIPANLVTLSMPPGTIPDLTPLSYVATGLISGYALLRYGLLRLVPVARGLVLDRLRDAVIVISHDDRLIDVNQAGDRLLRASRPDLPPSLSGLPFDQILPAQRPARVQSTGQGADGEYEVDLPTGRVILDIRLEDLTDRRGRSLGTVIVLRDITELYRLREHLAEQAVRDELTGLYNRRHLLATLEGELAVRDADRSDLCVVMIDIDHFKSVNDQHGHLVGDALLAAIARTLADGVREDDIVARYGGEEFAILLPGVCLEQALDRTQDLRRQCAAVKVITAAGPVSRTVSAGVVSVRDLATHNGDGCATPQTLLRAADQALYLAKNAGRNQVVAAG
jgi:diguanylate cyclase (GGDEF)-like protein